MTEKNKFAFLESNTTGTGELLIHKALAKGLAPIFITSDPNKYSFLPLENVELVVLDSSTTDILFNYLSQIKNLIGIYSSSEFHIENASWLANKLGLPGANLQSIKICRNKYLLHQALVNSEINVPHTRRVFNFDEANDILAEFSFPCIVKPSSSSGSRGVKLCETKEDCLHHIYLLLKDEYGEVIIQEFIDAPEFSVEVCSLHNNHKIIGITKKYLSSPPYFIETGHDFPALILTEIENQIKYVITKMLSILNFTFGFTHIEIKIKNEEIFIIEVNPRLAGGMIPVLIEKAAGIDLLENLIDLYSNHYIDMPIISRKFAAIRHLIPSNAGKITRLDFSDMSSVDEVKFIKNCGMKFEPHGDFRDRVAYVIVSDNEWERCNDRVNQALHNFDINVESPE
jgi:argininosuccinate lyase